jgi:hypothetical protein
MPFVLIALAIAAHKKTADRANDIARQQYALQVGLDGMQDRINSMKITLAQMGVR